MDVVEVQHIGTELVQKGIELARHLEGMEWSHQGLEELDWLPWGEGDFAWEVPAPACLQGSLAVHRKNGCLMPGIFEQGLKPDGVDAVSAPRVVELV